MNGKILEIRNLSVEYYRRKEVITSKIIPAVSDVSLELNESETLGLVGESGCGKTTLALAILRLILPNEGKITNGEVIFRDTGNARPEKVGGKLKTPACQSSGREDILKLDNEELRKIRGRKISIIFQDPFTSLNPVIRVGEQIAETLRIHQLQITNYRLQIKDKVLEILRQVRISEPERVYDSYPHQLSGGMQQRAMIAMAICANPKILIADEPTTALDVTTQREILELLKTLKKELHMSIVLITHNFGIISQYADRVAVMYAGEIVEETRKETIFFHPLHPYTQALLRSLPKTNEKKSRLAVIPGQVPDMFSLPSGCKFHPRCDKIMKVCSQEVPKIKEVNGTQVCCFLY